MRIGPLLTGLLFLAAPALAAGLGAGETCTGAGYRSGTVGFDMCVSRVAGDDPLAALEADDTFGAAPLSGRRGDEDDALAALEQGKGLTVEVTRLPRRVVDVQAVGNGALLNFGGNQAPPGAAPPPASAPVPTVPSNGMFGSLFPGLNFGD